VGGIGGIRGGQQLGIRLDGEVQMPGSKPLCEEVIVPCLVVPLPEAPGARKEHVHHRDSRNDQDSGGRAPGIPPGSCAACEQRLVGRVRSCLLDHGEPDYAVSSMGNFRPLGERNGGVEMTPICASRH